MTSEELSMTMMRGCVQVLLFSACASVIGLTQTTTAQTAAGQTTAAQATAPQTTASIPSILSLDKYTPEELAQRAEKLKQTADKSDTGSASEVLVRYPGHYTMLGFRDRSGGAELHRDYADIDVILDGSATLITGGTMVDAKSTAEGEMRGPSIQGGQSATIHKGDILHIPANTPHQMLIPAGGSLTYFVIKALEPSSPH